MPVPEDIGSIKERLKSIQKSTASGKVRERVKWRQKCEAEREAERLRQFDSYLDALSLIMECDRILDEERPKKYSDGWNNAFYTALVVRRELQDIMEELSVMISITEERKNR